MDERIARLEEKFDGMGKMIELRFDHVDRRFEDVDRRFEDVDRRFDKLDIRLDRIEDKIPSKWDMAQVVFFVVGALMAAALFGPRLIALLPAAG